MNFQVTFKKTLTASVALCLFMSASISQAAIPPQYTFTPPAEYGQVQMPSPLVDQSFMKKVIPLNLRPTSDDEYLITRIIDHSIHSILNTPAIQNLAAAKAVQAVEQGITSELSFKGEDPKSIAHKVSFRMLALQQEAKLDYSGLTQAQMKINFEHETMAFELKERIGENQEIVLNHHQPIKGTQSSQHLAWRIRW